MTTMTMHADQQAYVLRTLADSNGARLHWQFSGADLNLFAQARDEGIIKFDAALDCYVHPEAIRGEENGTVFYTMPEKEPAAYRQLKARGFDIWHTGGGCTAWRCELAGGGYVMITTDDGPDHEFDGGKVAVGFYDAEGDEWVTFYDAKFQTSED